MKRLIHPTHRMYRHITVRRLILIILNQSVYDVEGLPPPIRLYILHWQRTESASVYVGNIESNGRKWRDLWAPRPGYIGAHWWVGSMTQSPGLDCGARGFTSETVPWKYLLGNMRSGPSGLSGTSYPNAEMVHFISWHMVINSWWLSSSQSSPLVCSV